MRRFVAVLLVLCAAAPLQAKDLRPLSLRELTYRAGAVVLADPVEPVSAGKFKVTYVLRGHVKPETTIALTDADRNLYSLATFTPVDPDNPRPAPVEALLFLAPADQGQPAQLVPSGLLICLSDGMVLTPRQQQNPDVFAMTPQENRLWATVVRDTKAAATAINEVSRLKAAPDKERTASLLSWIERHRMEFGGGFYDGERTGWGSLETDVFDWICAAARVEDCWAAQRLYAELNHGAVLPMKRACFGSAAGRDFLLQLALNGRVLDGDRARAVTLLAHPMTLSSCSDADLDVILQKLPPLLHEPSAELRTRVIAALLTIHTSRGNSEQVQVELKNALPALEKAYKAEPPGAARDQFVEVIHTLGGAEHWKQVSGNKAGVAALLRDFDMAADHYHFWLQVMPATEKMYERPSLVLERLDAKEKVLETKTLPLPLANAPKWEDGWTPGDLLLVQFPKGAMTASAQGPPRGGPYNPGGRNPGGQTTTWRISVRGTVGKEKLPWTSEPKLVVARPAAISPEDYPYPIGDK